MNNNQQNSKEITQEQDNFYFRFREWIVLYLDITLRGLISFIVIGILLTLLFVGIFHMKFIWILPLSLVVSIMSSPFLSRVKLGEIIMTKYENWINKKILKK